MNRDEARKFKRAAKARGVDTTIADLLIRAKRTNNPPKDFQEGDKVRLNVKSIKAHPDYERLTDRYHRFIDDQENEVFTVVFDKQKDSKTLVCLAEDGDGWLFWTGDLIPV